MQDQIENSDKMIPTPAKQSGGGSDEMSVADIERKIAEIKARQLAKAKKKQKKNTAKKTTPESTDGADVEATVHFEYEGVIYKRLPDNMVLDHNMRMMGHLQDDGSIEFYEGMEEIHAKEKVVSKYVHIFLCCLNLTVHALCRIWMRMRNLNLKRRSRSLWRRRRRRRRR
eukprot:SAG11_NODE_1497_length_4795_cov_18.378620_3_plen_170_part_00